MHGPVDSLLTSGQLAARPCFQLGTISIDPGTRTVSGPGGSVQLEPRVMQVLVSLADAEGAVVTRDLLFARCWGNVYVGDDSLNRAVAGVRRALASVEASFSVDTVPRTGYRLTGDGLGQAAAGEVEPGTGRASWSRRALLAGGLSLGAAAGVAWWAGNRPTPDPADALLARAQQSLRTGTAEGQRKAIALLDEAVKRSPGNANAWGQLALAVARVDEHVFARPVTSAAKVDDAAQRALSLDPGNADAAAARIIALPYYGSWLPVERQFEQFLARHTDHPYARDSYSFMLGAVGRMKESARMRLSLASDDLYDAQLQYRSIYCHWFLGQITEADQAAQRAFDMWPRFAPVWFARLWLLNGTGRTDRALEQIENERGHPDLPPPMLAALRSAHRAALSGDPAVVAATTKQVLGGVRASVSAVVNAFMLLQMMKSLDAAFGLAEAYYLERGPVIAALNWRPGQPFVPDQRRRKTNMLFTPLGVPMQQDSRFLPLMRDIGLQDYWDQRGVSPDFLAQPVR
ncbi:winged helix-turn-helix domain-containing protein [Sphingomonas glaciei]|uniref:Winged helix-turn-helix domain-containing protein n=1 Tax=Sphingomonas glaciei TaxID=2938948 RepID=A0ABY5MVE9_9SPHN|nr:winged helix-turn-helix domain-containing protein [Sphingomonas glaciei]UUR08458.1 winged helix-turn-helix domain-containing protein [Sphingomonas glaciei]